MKILISEDNETKYAAINEVISSIFPESEIIHKASVNGTLMTLQENEDIDLIIQDMQLPTFNTGEHFNPVGGLDIILDLKYDKKETPIIVCSSDEHSKTILEDAELEDIPFVLYAPISNQWQEELKTLLKDI